MSSKAAVPLPQTWLYDKKNGFICLEKPTTAYLYYRHKRLNLLSGEVTPYRFVDFFERLRQTKLISDDQSYQVYHLFYESALFFQNEELLDEQSDVPLAVELRYQKHQPYQFPAPLNPPYTCVAGQHGPGYQEYKKGFDKIQKHLLRGDAYQVNYTWPFLYRFQRKLGAYELLSDLWADPENIGAFAHASWLPVLGLLLVSNSPECLFQARPVEGRVSLESMPIKGTASLKPCDDIKKVWSKLQNSVKERAELNMITDLVRNDLSRIELPRAKVIGRALPLKVPGLLHQYSKVRIDLSGPVKLGRVLSALFPGGSVTGAPKKRVQQIINSVEKSPRGFYCGSTLVLGPKISAASINIRSGEYWPEEGLLKLHAGGGLTLASTVQAEFEEMHSKTQGLCAPLGIETQREKYNNFSRLVF